MNNFSLPPTSSPFSISSPRETSLQRDEHQPPSRIEGIASRTLPRRSIPKLSPHLLLDCSNCSALTALPKASPDTTESDIHHLYIYCRLGDVATVKAITASYSSDALKKQALKTDCSGKTALHHAAESESVAVIEAITELCTTDALKEQALKRDNMELTRHKE